MAAKTLERVDFTHGASVADGAHLTEFATELPHFEGLHLQNTTLFGQVEKFVESLQWKCTRKIHGASR